MDMEGVDIVGNKNNGVLIGLVVILIILVLGLMGYIAYDKGLIFNNENKVQENNKENEENNSTVEEDNDNDNVIVQVDLTKPLNTTSINYENASDADISSDYGIAMSVNSDKKSITLSVDWEKFGPLSGASIWGPDVDDYQITGFSKEISSTFVGDKNVSINGLEQDAFEVTLFYLMSDGTVEYTPLFKLETDSQGNKYYVMNLTYEYLDGKIVNEHFVTNGSLNDVNDVIKLYNVYAYSNYGWMTTIGATADGNFYDLGHIISN